MYSCPKSIPYLVGVLALQFVGLGLLSHASETIRLYRFSRLGIFFQQLANTWVANIIYGPWSLGANLIYKHCGKLIKHPR